jgi:hypothetical protein
MVVTDMWLHVEWKDIILGEAKVSAKYNVEF